MSRTAAASLAIALLIVAGSVAAFVPRNRIPNEWNPWAPLRLDELPNFLTRFKLARASGNVEACRETLAQAGWSYTAIDDQMSAAGCGYRNAVRIDRMQATVDSAFTLSCRAALSLALWERHVLQPAAIRHFGVPVGGIEHFGSYSCRSVYGRPDARMSHHATADALDVAGFVINGRRLRILSAWPQESRDAAFLRETREGACRFFDAVLGPDYNVAHRDHFHLDRGSFRACR